MFRRVSAARYGGAEPEIILKFVWKHFQPKSILMEKFQI